MSDRIQVYSSLKIPTVEQEIRLVMGADRAEVDPFFGMIHYHMGWRDGELKPISAGAGKRIRPLLCLLGCESAGGEWHQALSGAVAVEILHNFSLVHDDIQDSSPTRRGRATVWKIWGLEQAINVGDAMFALAHIAMSRLVDAGVSAETVNRAMRRLDETCIDLTYGQFKDMQFEERQAVSVKEYLQMIDGKTAALLSFSCELGAMVTGSDDSIIQHFASFGRDLGLAFQIRDDILGIWGDESLIGKSAATDIANKKKSLPVLYGLAESNDLRFLYSQDEEDADFVLQAVSLLNDAGAKEFAEEHEERYVNSALEHLEAAQARSPAKETLLDLVNILLNRQA
jgi:geranylgeranyl diphosphate synthase type I